jgi:ATP-dependent DNA helicase DinG
LIDADLDISQMMIDALFLKFPTVVLCSATMTTNRSFGFFRQRLGLDDDRLSDRTITENIYDAPFDYRKQALLTVPTDMPSPMESGFLDAVVDRVWQAIQASRGNAFVLFTSYGMLKSCYDKLIDKLQDNRYSVWKQGDDNRNALLTKFKATDRSVLFGTDSFWEGVDVVGEALRCVIIVKLPFKVPSEPIIKGASSG